MNPTDQPRHTVVLLARNYPPQIGGVSAYCESVAHALAQKGVHVLVLTPRHEVEIKKNGSRIEIIPIPIHRFRFLNVAAYFISLLQVLRTRKVDAVLAGYWIPMGIVACFISHFRRLKYGVFIYGAEILGCPSRWKRHLLQRVCQRADYLFPIAEYTAEKMTRIVQDPPCLRIVPCVMEVERMERYRSGSKEAIKRSLNLEGKRVLLTASTLEPRKGHLLTLEALSRIKDEFPDLIYVYTGKGSAQDAIEKRIQQLGLKERVRGVGFVDYAELMNLYQAADLFIMVSYNPQNPHDYEGFGIVYLEAAYWQVPSIAARYAGPAEVIEHGTTGMLVDPENIEELETTLRNLLSHPEEITRMGLLAKERALKKYSPSAMAECLYEALFSGDL